MRINDYPLILEFLANNFIPDYLEPGSKDILIGRARTLGSDIRKNRNWRFFIPKEKPVIFKANSHDLQIDIACDIEGNSGNITKQNIILRI